MIPGTTRVFVLMDDCNPSYREIVIGAAKSHTQERQ